MRDDQGELTLSVTAGPQTHGQEATAAAGSTRPQVRLMVLDDHPAVRMGLVQLLEAQPDFDVCAVCINAEAAIAQATAQEIDVAVVDYQLPGRNGLWICRRLKRLARPPAVVVFSAFADHRLAACCAVAQADAVLNKGVLGSELCDAIRSVARGRRLLPKVPRPFADTLRAKLAEPEQLLFGMMLSAIPRKEIRRALRISEHELDARAEAMLRTLEALPGEAAHAGRRRGGLDLDRTVSAR
jgi:DNA-binding NarL/FixJ family response regulator